MERSEVRKILDGVGAFAEMSLAFYRAEIGAGATEKEAYALTLAFMYTLFDKSSNREPEDIE